MAHPIMFDEADPLLGRLRALALALPDAAEKISHGRPAFFTTKIFAYCGGSVKLHGVHQQHEHSVLVLVDPGERMGDQHVHRWEPRRRTPCSMTAGAVI